MNNQGERLGASAAAHLAQARDHIRDCTIGPGLSDSEFARIESDYGFEFADDHCAFLAAGLPISKPPQPGRAWARPWPDWRNGDPDELRERLAWPIEGVLFDVEQDGFWYDAWGDRPSDPGAALAAARGRLSRVPAMVPVCGHRFLPAGRGTCGHPVLSMWQTDIIFYGTNLDDYIQHEFAGTRTTDGAPIATVPFWRDLL